MVKTKKNPVQNVFYLPNQWNENVMIKKFNVDFLRYMAKSFKEQSTEILNENSKLSIECKKYVFIHNKNADLLE